MIYKVMAANTSGDLGELVTERLREGWVLQGGVATYDMIFYQAIVSENVVKYCDRIDAASERAAESTLLNEEKQ